MSDKDKREKVVVRTSIMCIFINIALAGFKAFVGVLSHSIAIISDAVNNLSDVLSSLITIIGTKLAGKSPDKKHPYGYGRMEYMSSLLVSEVVLYAGIKALMESVNKIFHPEDVEYSLVTFTVIIASIVVKFFLSIILKKRGKNVNSDSLTASGIDSFNDAILTTSVLASAIIYLLFHINLEAYVGVLVSVVIIKSGIDLIKESVDNMLETRVESGLSKKQYGYIDTKLEEGKEVLLERKDNITAEEAEQICLRVIAGKE